ncbi:MAG: flagellar hook capping FlgD N-terminal domain-containing protein [Lacrimispora sp.]|uniref:flagellar hook capping FlgD N-terminal domain-containing protein n=1 Tax=Lacrimispora sp. TaxID=2719234 RepID=UPI0039E62AA7
MSNVNGVNSYYNSLGAVANSTETTKTASNSDLTTEGFFKLLAAQLQNQDMSNPMDNSEMMTQMTQIAMMQAMSNFSTAMNDFAQVNTINYGTSMMGKEVMLAVQDKTGAVKKITGTVTRVDIFGGNPTLYIDDDVKTGYPISSIMSVYEEGHTPPADLGDTKDPAKVAGVNDPDKTDGTNDADGANNTEDDLKTDTDNDSKGDD